MEKINPSIGQQFLKKDRWSQFETMEISWSFPSFTTRNYSKGSNSIFCVLYSFTKLEPFLPRGHEFVRRNIFAIFVGNVSGIITMLTLKCVLDNVRLTSRSILTTKSLQMNMRIPKYTFDLYEDLAQEDLKG